MAKAALPEASGVLDANLFDAQPVALEGFTLNARGVTVQGKPSIVQWQAAMSFAWSADSAAPFWIGDLWNYTKDRPEWREKLPQMLADIGIDLEVKTLWNYGSISTRVTGLARELAPRLGYADAVACLEPDDQEEVLREVRTEGLGLGETRKLVRNKLRPVVLEGQAVLEGQYRVIYSDPPWQYRQSTPTASGALAKAEDHYATLSNKELMALPVKAHTQTDAILFLWVPSPLLFPKPGELGPNDVANAWGFEYKSSFVWDKVLPNFGHYNSVVHEFLLVFVRGSCLPTGPTPNPKSVFTERRSDRHSEKPDDVRHMIERRWPVGPYLELFGRKKVEGWTVYGNDPKLWQDPPELQEPAVQPTRKRGRKPKP